MEAARTLIDLPERMRMRRFTADCEELRPLGIAYVMRNFGHSLDRADAEDAVAEVIIRFDRLARAGRPPDRLRPAFFSSVRNAAVDQLRYRGVRPTAPLEAAATLSAEGPGPAERAESREDLARLREAMARIHPNYRTAIVLRFGLGLTVPQIAERLGLSLPAAKKRVLRSTTRIRERMEEIEGREFCPQMREIAARSMLDGEIAGIAEEAEVAAIRAHLEHCGACRGFLASLRADLHELGGAALLAGLASTRIGLGERLLSGVHGVGHAVHAGAGRLRLAGYRLAGAFSPEGQGSAGLLAGTGQKFAAACTAGAAGAATCLATGIVGPGLGAAVSHHVAPPPVSPPAHVREAAVMPPAPRPLLTHTEPVVGSEDAGAEAPVPVAPRPRAGVSEATQKAKPTHEHHTEKQAAIPAATPDQTEQSEFGLEEEAPSPAPAEAAAPATESRTVEETPRPTTSSPGSSGQGGGSTGAGQEEFGFGG
jgi:RNA polymerase sigma factor (sigma-70 family)